MCVLVGQKSVFTELSPLLVTELVTVDLCDILAIDDSTAVRDLRLAWHAGLKKQSDCWYFCICEVLGYMLCYCAVMCNCLSVGTFKLKKMDYKKDGFNPSVVKDRLFYLNPNSGEYEELLAKVYNDIVTGKIRI